MHALTKEDREIMRALKLNLIFDLRTSSERTLHPSLFGDFCPRHMAFDHEHLAGNLNKLVAATPDSEKSVADHITASYRTMPFRFASIFRALFIELSLGNVPLVFHCFAGKDRTGIASALILTALGVPRDVIMEDYAMTNMVADMVRDFIIADRPEIAAREMQPLLIADPAYLTAAFDEIETRHGTCEAYFKDMLALDDQLLTELRHSLTEFP
jgi:protein-tyrosine phosphatase